MAKFARLGRRPAIFIFFSIVMLFAAANPVFGSGKQDAALTRADELIKIREHDEAILVLSDFARRNPDKFDQVQVRMRKIQNIRDEFNRTADELIETIMYDPGNNDKILALSRKLYTLESENSPLLLNFVSRTREIAEFNHNRNLLRGILERGRLLLDRGDSLAALQVYAEGMNFMRNEFFAAGYGESIENEVRRETERVNTILATFQQTSSQMGTISAELVRLINAQAAGQLDMARITEITGRLTPAMDRFIALKQSLYITVNAFDRILNELRAIERDMIDRNHLSFFTVAIRGRTEEDIQEGMLGAFDNYWNNSIGSVLNAISQIAVRDNAASLTAFRAGNYTTAVSALNRTDSVINLSPLYFEKHLQLFFRPQATVLFGTNIENTQINRFLELRALSEANNSILQASNIATRQNIDRSSLTNYQNRSISGPVAINNETITRNNIMGMRRSLSDIVTRANQVNTTISAYHSVTYINNAVEAIERLNGVFATEEQQSAQRYYTIAQHYLNSNLPERRAQLERGRNLLNGESRTTDGVTTVLRYPTEALVELSALVTATTSELQLGNNVLNQYRNEQTAISSNEGIAATRVNHQSTVNELNEIHTQGVALAEAARVRSSQAEAYRMEGERLYREAQAAFQRQNYDVAREQIQRSSDRLSDSLAIQESPALRQMRDTLLVSLGQSIATAENETIITEVRNLVNNARNSYFSGNFQQAEDSLVRARNRWRITNTDENEEIVYWLGIVRTAMSVSGGRVIPPTAPLYSEMSQLLSQAQRNFEEGVRFINAGQRTAGLTRFDEARQLTREVRLMFPVNQEAGLLDLRIEQFLDPAAFNASFEQRLRNAIEGTRRRSLESFADLQNLAEINPRYPNMRAIVTQAEIDIGIRQPPPNPAIVARSRELTVSASRIIDGNQTAQYEVALAQLNEAISLNPQNLDAPLVRDRLLSRMSVPRGIVLSSEDEADYQRALRELNAGNNLVAFALVERLMQNPSNRNITKLVELQRRIQSVL